MPIPCQTENNCCKVKSANYCHWTFRYYFTSIYFPIDHNDTCNYLARNRNRNIESIVRSNVKRIIVEYNIQREEFNFTLILQIFRETNKSSNFNLNTCGAYESQRFFFYFWTAGRNKAGYFISLWTSFDIILHSLPENPNYFAISLKLRLTSLTGTFTREKILSRLTYFYIFLVFWIALGEVSARVLSKKNSRYLILIDAATRFFIASFYSSIGAVKINRPLPRIKIQQWREILLRY